MKPPLVYACDRNRISGMRRQRVIEKNNDGHIYTDEEEEDVEEHEEDEEEDV